MNKGVYGPEKTLYLDIQCIALKWVSKSRLKQCQITMSFLTLQWWSAIFAAAINVYLKGTYDLISFHILQRNW